jgi:GNAT superfamily N-acetyltransferase
MTDMLVKLYELPPFEEDKKVLEAKGYIFKRPIAPESSFVSLWASKHFSELWGNEVSVAFTKQPVSCFVALKDGEIAGFACYDTTTKGFFGPTGVHEKFRGEGLGKVLLLMALNALWEMGYAYAIIGGAGPTAFYEKTVRATAIAGSNPGIYKNLIKK